MAIVMGKIDHVLEDPEWARNVVIAAARALNSLNRHKPVTVETVDDIRTELNSVFEVKPPS